MGNATISFPNRKRVNGFISLKTSIFTFNQFRSVTFSEEGIYCETIRIRTMKTALYSFIFLVINTINAQDLAPLQVTVLNAKGKPYSGDKIYFVGQQTNKTLFGVTNSAGKFLIHLPQGDVYDVRIQSIAEEVEYNTIEIPTLSSDEHFEQMDIVITYEAAKNYTLSSLQFESGKSIIITSSYALLDNLIEIMTLKPTMKIEIAGHTDSDGDDANNLVLSQQRADAVKDYLIKKGIASNRIVAHGYGESQPVAENTTVSGKQQNRRTEIKVL